MYSLATTQTVWNIHVHILVYIQTTMKILMSHDIAEQSCSQDVLAILISNYILPQLLVQETAHIPPTRTNARDVGDEIKEFILLQQHVDACRYNISEAFYTVDS